MRPIAYSPTAIIVGKPHPVPNLTICAASHKPPMDGCYVPPLAFFPFEALPPLHPIDRQAFVLPRDRNGTPRRAQDGIRRQPQSSWLRSGAVPPTTTVPTAWIYARIPRRCLGRRPGYGLIGAVILAIPKSREDGYWYIPRWHHPRPAATSPGALGNVPALGSSLMMLCLPRLTD